MLTMSVVNIEMYEALVVANVPKAMAKAAAAQVVTGQDLTAQAGLIKFGQNLRTEIARRFAEQDKRFDKIDKRLAEQDKRFDKIEKSLAVLMFAVLSGGPLILGLLVKLIFFP